MGRRSRHSAKTGDKALYRSRDDGADGSGTPVNDDDDPMHNEVERFHNQREEEETIRLDEGDEVEDDDDGGVYDDGITTHRETVFDLGGSRSSSSEDEDDDESDDDSDEVAGDRRHATQKSRGATESSASSDDDSDDDEDSTDDEDIDAGDSGGRDGILNWGGKKRDYYHGDTADLEIGQDAEDAHLELEAGREVERSRLEDMEEGDFLLDGNDDGDVGTIDAKAEGAGVSSKQRKRGEKRRALSEAGAEEGTVETLRSGKDRRRALEQLSKREQLKLLKAGHPELLPLIGHFRSPVSELANTTMAAGEALLRDGGGKEAEAVGATPAGMQYLITKSMLQASAALNLTLYLLLKADHAAKIENDSSTVQGGINTVNDDDDDDDDDIRSHPVMDRLNQLSQFMDKLNEGVEERIPGLKDQLSSLVKAAALMENGETDSDTDDDEENDDDAESKDFGGGGDRVREAMRNAVDAVDDDADAAPLSSTSSDDEERAEDERDARRRVMNEARFSLRHKEAAESCRPKARTHRLTPSSSDFGDDEKYVDSEKAIAAGRSLASTMNSISQRSAVKSEKAKKRAGDGGAEGADDENEYDRFQRGLGMMEADLGGGGLGEDDDGDQNGPDGDGNDDDDLADDDDDDGFYQNIKLKSKAKKEAKKTLYAVAPKYPRLEGEVEGERALGRFIMKNRGLVAHKAKINRNPRVKKREQYRKALIRRKGAVREVRTDEGHTYGGEATGIKSSVSRSRKLGVSR